MHGDHIDDVAALAQTTPDHTTPPSALHAPNSTVSQTRDSLPTTPTPHGPPAVATDTTGSSSASKPGTLSPTPDHLLWKGIDERKAAMFHFKNTVPQDDPCRMFNGRFRFDKLPPFCRKLVYEYIVGEADPVSIIGSSSAFETAKKRGAPVFMPPEIIAIGGDYLKEATLYFLRENVLKVHNMTAFQWWLSRLPKDQRRAATNILLGPTIKSKQQATTAARTKANFKSSYSKKKLLFVVEKDGKSSMTDDPQKFFEDDSEDDNDQEHDADEGGSDSSNDGDSEGGADNGGARKLVANKKGVDQSGKGKGARHNASVRAVKGKTGVKDKTTVKGKGGAGKQKMGRKLSNKENGKHRAENEADAEESSGDSGEDEEH